MFPLFLDIYLPVIGQSPVVDKKFLILQGLVEKERGSVTPHSL